AFSPALTEARSRTWHLKGARTAKRWQVMFSANTPLPRPSHGLPMVPMKTAASAARPLAPPLVATRGRVRLRTLLVTRWIGIAGQAAALVIVRYGLAYPLPIGWAAAVVGASAVLNLWLTSRRRGSALLSDRLAAAQLGYDLLQLAALLYLTGGLANPFAILILAPVIVSATVLSRRSTIWLSI